MLREDDHLVAHPTYRSLVLLSDEKVMEHLSGGCGDAIAVLYDRYCRLVMSVALKIVREHAEAEDLTQDIFVELCRTAAQFDPSRGTAKMWILRTSYRRSLNRRRNLSFHDSVIQRDLSAIANGIAPASPFQGLVTEESRRLARQLLSSLDSAQRQVIEMVHIQGLTLREVSEQLGATAESVRHRYYRGVRKLRELVYKEREPLNATQEALDAHA